MLDPDNLKVCEKFSVESAPTLIFLDPEGKKIEEYEGKRDAKSIKKKFDDIAEKFKSTSTKSQEDVWFETDEKSPVRIAGTLWKPKEVSGTKPGGAVLLHMLNRSRKDWNEFAKKLSEKMGIFVLAVDLRGHGASTLNRDFKEEDFKNMVHDAKAAVIFLRKQKNVDGDRITLIGASIGANVALIYAAGDEKIKGVVLLSPGLDYKGVKTEEAMKKYNKRPALLVASADDDYSFKSASTLAKVAQGQRKLQEYKKSGHGTDMFAGSESPKLNDLIIDWLTKQDKDAQFTKDGTCTEGGRHIGTADIGACKRCMAQTPSGSMTLCSSCGKELGVCSFCLKKNDSDSSSETEEVFLIVDGMH